MSHVTHVPASVLVLLQCALLLLLCCCIPLTSPFKYEPLKDPPVEELKIVNGKLKEVTIGLATTDWDVGDEMRLRLHSHCQETPTLTMQEIPFCPPDLQNRTCTRFIMHVPGDIELNNTLIELCIVNGNKSQLIQETHDIYRIRVISPNEGTDPGPETTMSSRSTITVVALSISVVVPTTVLALIIVVLIVIIVLLSVRRRRGHECFRGAHDLSNTGPNP